MTTVLAISPHPDDEALGTPMVLQGLAERGYRVVNAAASLGRPAQHERRLNEVTEACRRAGFDLVVNDPPARISSGDNLTAAEHQLRGWVRSLIEEDRPSIVVSPQVHDLHYGHEVVARAVRDALTDVGWCGLWWQWTIWGDLPFPTLYAPCTAEQLARATHVLAAYTGENERNDYQQMLTGRAQLNTALGSEKVFGFGAARASDAPYAEVLLEAQLSRRGWVSGTPRVLDLDRPVPVEPAAGPSLDRWLHSPSPRASLEAPGPGFLTAVRRPLREAAPRTGRGR